MYPATQASGEVDIGSTALMHIVIGRSPWMIVGEVAAAVGLEGVMDDSSLMRHPWVGLNEEGGQLHVSSELLVEVGVAVVAEL